MRQAMFIGLIAAALMIQMGCARYEFDLVEPPDLAQHVGEKRDAIVSRPPIEYRMRAREGRLVIAIVNNDSDPITLRGEESYIVDPRGQSRPLRGQTIAPGSFIKQIFPPLRPNVRPTGPSFGIGIGTVIGSNRHRSRAYSPLHPWHFHEPHYYVSYDDDDLRYWRWEGESRIRARFVYDRRGESLEHEFVIERKKM